MRTVVFDCPPAVAKAAKSRRPVNCAAASRIAATSSVFGTRHAQRVSNGRASARLTIR